MARSELVFPGDEIAWAEEFLPGPGTYEEHGMIYAARMGQLELDGHEHEAKVEAATGTPPLLKEGDIVIGRVIGLKKSFAIVQIKAKADEPTRPLFTTGGNATLHIAKIARDYLERIENALRLGDIIRARVLEPKPSVQLTTKDGELGVLLARCPRCRTEMEAKGFGLVCPECDWKSSGKLAADYGAGFLMPPDDVEERLDAREDEHDRAGIEFRGPPVYRPESDDRGGPRGRGGPRRGGDRRGGGNRGRGGGGGRSGDRRGRGGGPRGGRGHKGSR